MESMISRDLRSRVWLNRKCHFGFWFWLSIVLLCLALPGIAAANAEVSPFLSIKESYIDDETAGVSDSGFVTTVSPGIIVEREAPRSTVLLDYQYDIVRAHGLDRDDGEFHNLDLFADYEHSPGLWVSTLYANSELTNPNIDSIQNTRPEFVDENTQELHTVEVDTTVTDKLSSTVQYITRLNADYTDIEDEGDSRGYGAFVGFDNLLSPGRFTWRTDLDSQVSEDDDLDDRIDELTLWTNYQFNRRWSSFLEFTRTETKETDLNENSALIGVTWLPGAFTSISIGAGKRENDDIDDEDTYTFDASHRRQNFVVSANYTEEITTRRADTLSQVRNDNGALVTGTTQGISAEPILQKRASIVLSVNGKYSTIVTSLFSNERVDRSSNEADEDTNGMRFYYSRNLSPKNSLSLDLLAEETEAEEDNELLDLSIFLTHEASLNQTWIFELGWIEQESSSIENEYERSLASIEYIVSF